MPLPHTTPWLSRLLAASTLGAALLVASCQPEDRCDVGYRFSYGQCLPEPGAAPDAGAASDSGGADGIGFGTPCEDGISHRDCQSPTTSVCLIAPGTTRGVCSQVGCDQAPALCPPGWRCFDLSSFQPGAPFGCVPF